MGEEKGEEKGVERKRKEKRKMWGEKRRNQGQGQAVKQIL